MVVSGGGKETEEGKIVWPDWTVGGAERFLEWLYTGDYGFPYPRPLSETTYGSDDNGDSFDVADELVAVDSHGELSKVDRNKAPPSISGPSVAGSEEHQNHKAPAKAIGSDDEGSIEAPLNRLQDLAWPGCHTPEEKASEGKRFDDWVGRLLWSPDQLDYEATFLAHAELYVMACRYMLMELKNLAWQRLRSVLIEINNPFEGSWVMGNLVTLISYAYRETSNEPGRTEPLRQLVTTYAAIHCGHFGGSRVDDLIMSTELSDREFVSDFTRRVAQKTIQLEKANADLSGDLTYVRASALGATSELNEEKKQNKSLKRKLTNLGVSSFT